MTLKIFAIAFAIIAAAWWSLNIVATVILSNQRQHELKELKARRDFARNQAALNNDSVNAPPLVGRDGSLLRPPCAPSYKTKRAMEAKLSAHFKNQGSE